MSSPLSVGDLVFKFLLPGTVAVALLYLLHTNGYSEPVVAVGNAVLTGVLAGLIVLFYEDLVHLLASVLR